MRSLARLVIASLIALAFASAAQAASAVKLVAAENFYGGIARGRSAARASRSSAS